MISCCAPWRRTWRTSSASWRAWPDGWTDNDARSAAAQVEIEPSRRSAAADARAQAEAALSGQSELLEKSGALAEEISGRKSDLAALAAEREATVRSAADLRALCAGSLW